MHGVRSAEEMGTAGWADEDRDVNCHEGFLFYEPGNVG